MSSKPQKSADHLSQATSEQKDSIIGLIEQAESELAAIGADAASREDKAQLEQSADEAGVDTSEKVEERESEMLEDLGFDTEFFLGNELGDDDDDINEELPETPDPTREVQNSSATPEVDIDEFFGPDSDDDINIGLNE